MRFSWYNNLQRNHGFKVQLLVYRFEEKKTKTTLKSTVTDFKIKAVGGWSFSPNSI